MKLILSLLCLCGTAVEEQRLFLEQALQNSGNRTALAPVVNVAHPNIGASNGTGQKAVGNHYAAVDQYRGHNFAPLGFVDFTWYGRSTNVGSGIGTSFGGIPFNNAVSGHISENNTSTQNSRIGFRVDSTVVGAKVLGYVEARRHTMVTPATRSCTWKQEL